jgi:hypothetical protein
MPRTSLKNALWALVHLWAPHKNASRMCQQKASGDLNLRRPSVRCVVGVLLGDLKIVTLNTLFGWFHIRRLHSQNHFNQSSWNAKEEKLATKMGSAFSIDIVIAQTGFNFCPSYFSSLDNFHRIKKNVLFLFIFQVSAQLHKSITYTQQHYYNFPIKIKPWRDSNPGFLSMSPPCNAVAAPGHFHIFYNFYT